MQDTWSEVVGAIATTYNTRASTPTRSRAVARRVCYDGVRTNASAGGGVAGVLAKMAAKAATKGHISEAHDQTHMADLHAYLTIYGFIEICGAAVLAWQVCTEAGSTSAHARPSQPTQKDPRSGKLMFNETESAAWRAIAAQGFIAGLPWLV